MRRRSFKPIGAAVRLAALRPGDVLFYANYDWSSIEILQWAAQRGVSTGDVYGLTIACGSGYLQHSELQGFTWHTERSGDEQGRTHDDAYKTSSMLQQRQHTIAFLDLGTQLPIFLEGVDFSQVRVLMCELPARMVRREHPCGGGWRVLTGVLDVLDRAGFSHIVCTAAPPTHNFWPPAFSRAAYDFDLWASRGTTDSTTFDDEVRYRLRPLAETLRIRCEQGFTT